ncbi:hypothetical protein AVEN_192954-1 [Araneus ventricosus]|uniref:Uncharacterized protein n=1 Tax=Araneus ventricosus TaxID=182803 RepID=A0A4Y2KCP3_ARAVE|nr:hypothetical protein AVEN_192954-1 [Araneus ventricosus]
MGSGIVIQEDDIITQHAKAFASGGFNLDDIRSDSEDGDTLPHQNDSSSDFSVDEGEGIHSVFLQRGKYRFCNDVQGLKKYFDIEYDPSEWCLFIDSSKTSLKTVLLHNGNSFASLPLGHSVHLEENYNDLSMILEKINYHEHRWMVCRDFKMLTRLLGQQAGYTKYPCFLCL